jgi:hypothetical protein
MLYTQLYNICDEYGHCFIVQLSFPSVRHVIMPCITEHIRETGLGKSPCTRVAAFAQLTPWLLIFLLVALNRVSSATPKAAQPKVSAVDTAGVQHRIKMVRQFASQHKCVVLHTFPQPHDFRVKVQQPVNSHMGRNTYE